MRCDPVNLYPTRAQEGTRLGGYMVLALFLATLLCAMFAPLVVPALVRGGPVRLVGFNGPSILVAFAIYVAGAAYLGRAFAISLMAGFVLHELGHVLAVRQICGGVARFRLAPMLSGGTVAEQAPQDDGEMFFVALMGAGFSLAPMVLALTLAPVLSPILPDVGQFLLVFGATLGAMNFIMLLPFPPMDGGICASVAARNFWPALGPGMTVFMVAALSTAGIRHGSIALVALAAFGAYSLILRISETSRPLRADHGLVALAAYAFTLASHFTAGWLLFSLMF